MIIVSQDKSKIVNFENVEKIYIDMNEEKKCRIFAEGHNIITILGEYETEERAKEILNDIETAYNMNGFEFEKDVATAMVLSRFHFSYEMPE